MVSLYIEYVILDNLAMNYIILALAARFAPHETRILRKLAAAFLGAVYGAAALLPGFGILQNFFMKILLSIVMVAVGIGEKNIKRMLVKIGAFYAVSFMLGGVMFGMFYLFGMGTYYSGAFIIEGFPFRVALLAAFLGAILIEWYRRRMARRCGFETEIEIEFRGKKRLHALIDTANTLIEPLSGLPVVIVSFKHVKDIFTPAQISLVTGGKADGRCEFQCRAVPYRTVSGEGVMLSFKPKRARILQKNAWHDAEFYIGVSEREARGAEALLPSAALDICV